MEEMLRSELGRAVQENRELNRRITQLQADANASETARRELAEQVRTLSAIVGAINMGTFLERYQKWQSQKSTSSQSA